MIATMCKRNVTYLRRSRTSSKAHSIWPDFFFSSVSISLTTHIKANFHVRTKTLHYDKFFVIYIVVCFFFFLSRNIFSGFSHHAFVFLCPVTCVFYRYKIDWIKYTLTVFGCKCHSVIETWQRHNQRIIIFIKTS